MATRKRLSKGTIALERLLARLRRLGSELGGLDAYERWGKGNREQREEAEALASAAATDLTGTTAALEALVERTRTSNPDAIEEWVGAHVELIDRYLEQLASENNRERDTERFVAKQERDGWTRVRSGFQALVNENSHYVKHDPELYRAFFGFEPFNR